MSVLQKLKDQKRWSNNPKLIQQAINEIVKLEGEIKYLSGDIERCMKTIVRLENELKPFETH